MLVMTATPIPRSLCLTQFGDLDLSVVHELPPGRQKVVTTLIREESDRKRTWAFLRQQIQAGRQLYVVCPRIGDDSEELGDLSPPPSLPFSDEPPLNPRVRGERDRPYELRGESLQNPDSTGAFDPIEPPVEFSKPARRSAAVSGGVEWVTQRLQQNELRGMTVGMVHGRMDRDQQATVMNQFREGALQVLVSTTVIEVGVDVANATLMVINEAERFGLSQLLQLRGRVARGQFQGYCFLFSNADTEEAATRLAALESTSDGFRIAEIDFEMRGPGNVLGTRQHGDLPLRVADLVRDKAVLEQARKIANEITESGQLDSPEYRPLKSRVLERFSELMDLPQMG